LLLGLCMGLLAWRTGIGGLAAWRNGSGSMMLGFPEWIVYVFMVPPLVLTAVIGLVQAWQGFEPEAQA
jgi:TRAP-type C4-dicarboxylate transport system permease small subunit